MKLIDYVTGARRVSIEPYRAEWVAQFEKIGRDIRSHARDAALRIDHIGSTAVPGLAAKDVIDVQITVESLDSADTLTRRLRAAGYRQGQEYQYDIFEPLAAASPELRKLYMREPEGRRRVHVHIREAGLLNQRFALLFRDYLRHSDVVQRAYEQAKRRAAEVYPYDIDGYLRLKEPVFRVIYEAASLWAQATGWQPDGDDL